MALVRAESVAEHWPKPPALRLWFLQFFLNMHLSTYLGTIPDQLAFEAILALEVLLQVFLC